MLSVSKDKINSLFEAIEKDKTLYLPVDNASGKANFEKCDISELYMYKLI